MQHIILLHGAIGAKDQLEPLAEKLREDYHVHTLNFSGHGGEPIGNGGFSIPAFAEEVVAYLAKHRITSANIFGYSMGGYVAMYIARHHPAVVDRVITLATKYHWDDAIASKEIKMLDPATIAQKVPAYAEQLEKRHQPGDWKNLLAQTSEMLVGLGRNNALSLEDYPLIGAPCLLLLGDKDKMITLDETLAVQHHLPHGTYCSLPNTAHPIEQVDAEMLARFIREFTH